MRFQRIADTKCYVRMTNYSFQHLYGRWMAILDRPLLDSTSDCRKYNILFLLSMYVLQGENSYPMIPCHYPRRKSTICRENTLIKHQHIITMVEPFNATAAWLWQIIQYPCSTIFWKGVAEGGMQGFYSIM